MSLHDESLQSFENKEGSYYWLHIKPKTTGFEIRQNSKVKLQLSANERTFITQNENRLLDERTLIEVERLLTTQDSLKVYKSFKNTQKTVSIQISNVSR
jgi:hypothetical protein